MSEEERCVDLNFFGKQIRSLYQKKAVKAGFFPLSGRFFPRLYRAVTAQFPRGKTLFFLIFPSGSVTIYLIPETAYGQAVCVLPPAFLDGTVAISLREIAEPRLVVRM